MTISPRVRSALRLAGFALEAVFFFAVFWGFLYFALIMP